MLSLDQDGEGQWCRKDLSLTDLRDLGEQARKNQKFLYSWSRKGVSGWTKPETFLVLSSEPPAFEPSLQYSVLHDPTA